MSQSAIKVATLASPLVIGSIIGYFFRPTKEWYGRLKKPVFAPPPYLFGIVWPILYVLIGVSAYMALCTPKVRALPMWYLFLAQLVANFLFSPVFFGLKSTLGGALVTVTTLVLAGAMAWQFYSTFKKPTAAYLLIPYLLWLAFASVLAITYFVLNH